VSGLRVSGFAETDESTTTEARQENP